MSTALRVHDVYKYFGKPVVAKRRTRNAHHHDGLPLAHAPVAKRTVASPRALQG